MEPGDRVLLCTDGIYRSLAEKDFVAAFARGKPSESCEALKAKVLSRASPQQDNLTVVALQCVGQGAVVGAIPSLRPRLAAAAAGLLLCVNLLAAGFVLNTLDRQMETLKTRQNAEQKGLAPNPSGKDSIERGPSPSKSEHGSVRQGPVQEAPATEDPAASPPEAGEVSPDANNPRPANPGKTSRKGSTQKKNGTKTATSQDPSEDH